MRYVLQATGFSSRNSLILLVILFFAFTVIHCVNVSAFDRTVTFYKSNGKKSCSFKVELAITPEEQSKGLMFRKHLNPKAGMLFVYHEDDIQSFWMKNTFIPLDIVFINSRFHVVSIHRFAVPGSEVSIVSQLPAQYVLEINAGRADRCGIQAGTKVTFHHIFQ